MYIHIGTSIGYLFPNCFEIHFQEYEMQKKFEEHQKVEAMEEAQKKEYIEKHKQEEEAIKHHKPVSPATVRKIYYRFHCQK